MLTNNFEKFVQIFVVDNAHVSEHSSKIFVKDSESKLLVFTDMLTCSSSELFNRRAFVAVKESARGNLDYASNCDISNVLDKCLKLSATENIPKFKRFWCAKQNQADSHEIIESAEKNPIFVSSPDRHLYSCDSKLRTQLHYQAHAALIKAEYDVSCFF